MQQPICLRTLYDIDNGIAGAVVNREIQRAVMDLVDRGEEDGKPRKVVIQLEMELTKGVIVVHVAAEAKLPPRRTRGTACQVGWRDGEQGLFFQSQNPESAAQPTFPVLDKMQESESM